MYNILVLEDNKEIADLLAVLFKKEGYTVKNFYNGKDFIENFHKYEPDLVILDILLPDASGLEICKEFKKQETYKDIPVIALTARNEKFDIIKGLTIGFDDYITKPFDNNILMAKINAILRREKNTKGKNLPIININNDLVINKESFSISLEGTEIKFGFLEFKILCYLIENKNKVINRTTLIDITRGDDRDSTDRSVDKLINKIRKKMGKYSDNIISVYGVGYCFKDSKKETVNC